MAAAPLCPVWVQAWCASRCHVLTRLGHEPRSTMCSSLTESVMFPIQREKARCGSSHDMLSCLKDVLLELAFQFEDSCAIRDDLRKAYEKCNDISQESRALICTFFKESSEKDRKLHLSMYGKAAHLEKQMGAKSAWFQEKYSDHIHGGIGCSSSQANCPLTEKELHQLRRDEEALKEMLEEEAMNKKAQ
ncbi:hypothetical protein Tco_0879372 [Tanacetum coccineum]